MNILIAKTFGIGNAICAIPMLRAIHAANPDATIHVLVGDLPDDFGSYDVFAHLVDELGIGLFRGSVPGIYYDVAVLAMPFDGRWSNGIHFRAKRVIDGMSRPDPSTFGFSSWKKHEVQYQMDDARELGYSSTFVPSCRFLKKIDPDPKLVYVGVGYKKDPAGLWKIKHWGNENFAKLIKMLLEYDKELKIVSTGDALDLVLSMAPISRLVADRRYLISQTSLPLAFKTVNMSSLYIGNDTGMAHVAASCSRKVVVVYKMENAIMKSRPWCYDYRAIDGAGRDVPPEDMFEMTKELLYAD